MFAKIKLRLPAALVSLATTSLLIITIPNLTGLVLSTVHGAPVADDYSSIKEFSMTDNWFDASLNSLLNTGRYMQSIIASISYGATGSMAPVILPGILITWLGVLIYLYVRLLSNKTSAKLGVIFSIFIASVVLSLIASLNRPLTADGTWFSYQMLFFSSAIVTYSIPLLIILTAIYSLARYGYFISKRTWLSMTLFSVLIYAIGLSNETLPATIVAVSPIAILVILIIGRRKQINKTSVYYTLLAACSSVIALLTLYFSPASMNRRAFIGASSDGGLLSGVLDRITYQVQHSVFRLSDIALIVASSLVIALILALYKKTAISRVFANKSLVFGIALLVSSMMALLVSTTLLVVGYGSTTPIYPRTLMIYQVLYASGGILLGIGLWTHIIRYCDGRKWPKYAILIALSLLSLFIILRVAPGQLDRATSQIVASDRYHAAWKELDYNLRHSDRGRDKIIVDEAAAGIGDGFTLKCFGKNFEEVGWLNKVISGYYRSPPICSNSTPVEWPL